jgi:PAS domain S-box-containing protein
LDSLTIQSIQPDDLGIGRLFGLLRDAVIVADASTGLIVLWNAAAESLFGYSADEARGQSIELLVPEPMRAAHRAGLQHYVATGHGQYIDRGAVLDMLALHKSGAELNVELSLSPLEPSGGSTPMVVAMVRDATERKRGEEARARAARDEAAREGAEAAVGRLAILDEASTLLAATPDYETTLRWVARLVVPRLADWCLLDIVDDSGVVRRLEVAHVDPAKHLLAQQLRQFPSGPANPASPASEVLRTGRSELYPDATDELLVRGSRDQEHLRLLRALTPCSAMVVPFHARGRTLGAFSLFSAESGRRYTEADLVLVEELARRCALAVDNSRILNAERRARAASQSLQAVTAALSRAVSPAEAAEIVIRQGLPGVGADAGGIALLDETRQVLEMIGTVGYPSEMLAAFQSTPLSASTPMAEAARTGQPVWRQSDDASAARFSDYARVNRAFKVGAAVPLIADDETVGALALSFTGNREFDDSDRAFITALAAQGALAVERARLYEAERRARAAAEASARQLDIILRGVADGIIAQDPAGHLIYANDAAAQLVGYPSARALTEAPSHERLGRFEILDDDNRPLPPQHLPAQRALHGESGAEQLVRFRVRATGDERWSFVSATPVRDDVGNVLFAISIFRDVTEEHRAQQRLAFLAEASTILGSSLDYELTLTRLAGLVVPTLADACAIDLITAGGAVRRLQIVHTDPELTDLARAIEAMGPPELDGPGAAARVLRTGEPIVMPVISEDSLATSARDDAHLRLLRKAHMRSSILVPLIARGTVLGELTLIVTARSGRSYGDADLILTEELARRAAQAMDNARLYAEAQDAETRSRQQATRSQALAAASEAFAAASLDVEGAIDTVAGRLCTEIGDGCMVLLEVEDSPILHIAAVQHPDPAAREEALRMLLVSPQRVDTGTHADVIRSGRTLLLEDIPPDRLLDVRPEFRAYLERFGLRSLVIAPLRTRAHALGTITLWRDVSSASYTSDDAVFLQELADRAALAIEHARLYSAERAARAEAQQAVRARDDFLSIAAHELRTPVTALKAAAQFLVRASARDRLDAERLARHLRSIDDQSDRLSALTNDLLDVARLRTGRMDIQLQPVNLAVLVQQILDRFREMVATQHQLTMSIGPDICPVMADPDRLEQVVTNLLTNAVKYSPDGGRIDVAVQRKDDGVQLTVSDVGIGVPFDAAESIFEPFGRADNASRRQIPGLGLGLHIARDIVQRHAGSIWATSPGENQGAAFHVWLPCSLDEVNA